MGRGMMHKAFSYLKKQRGLTPVLEQNNMSEKEFKKIVRAEMIRSGRRKIERMTHTYPKRSFFDKIKKKIKEKIGWKS